jgi:phosphate transport system protein
MTNNLHLSKHISKRYNDELAEVRSLIEEMGLLVIKQVKDGITALINIDVELSKKVISNDAKVNALEIRIDEACTHILATRQPAASDLRLIVSVIKTIAHIERIGDKAKKLGKNSVKIAKRRKDDRELKELKHLGEMVVKNLTRAMDALAKFDVDLAIEVIENDTEINDEYDNISRMLLTKMMEDPREIKVSLSIMHSARALETIGDNAKNICEYILFLVEGKDVRHSSLDDIKDQIIG